MTGSPADLLVAGGQALLPWLGAVAGGRIRGLAHAPWRRAILAALTVLPLQAVWLYLQVDGALGWDAALGAILLGCGLVWGYLVGPVAWRRLGLAVLVAGLGLLVLEGLGRWTLAAPNLTPARTVEPLARLGQQLLFPNHGRTVVHAELAATGGRPVVLHVGDSMINSGLIPRADTLVAALDRLDDTRAHINLGVPGTAPDYHLVVLRRWLARARPKAVVVYSFPMNDPSEIGKRYAVCGGTSVLLFDAALTELCSHPGGPSTDWARLVNSPAPALVRVLEPVSRVAARIEAGLEALRHRLAVPEGDETERWARLERVYEAMHAELSAAGVRLEMVHMPYLSDLRSEGLADSVTRQRRERLRAFAARRGIPWHDATAPLRAAIERDGERAVFPHGPEAAPDFHPGPLGHRRVAEWLAARGVGGAPRAEAADQGKG